MTNTWSKERIQDLKRTCYSHRGEATVEEKLTELNLHLSHYDKAMLIQIKNKEWREVERIATEISEQFPGLN